MSSGIESIKNIREPLADFIQISTGLKSEGINSKRNKFNEKNASYSEGIGREISLDMDDNTLLEKYLDKVDQDRREQEQRLSSNMEKLEERISRERKESEERLEKLFISTMESIKETNNKIDTINSNIDNKIDTINQKIDSKIDLMYEKMDSTNKWIIGTCLATILAVAAIAASVWF